MNIKELWGEIDRIVKEQIRWNYEISFYNGCATLQSQECDTEYETIYEVGTQGEQKQFTDEEQIALMKQLAGKMQHNIK